MEPTVEALEEVYVTVERAEVVLMNALNVATSVAERDAAETAFMIVFEAAYRKVYGDIHQD